MAAAEEYRKAGEAEMTEEAGAYTRPPFSLTLALFAGHVGLFHGGSFSEEIG